MSKLSEDVVLSVATDASSTPEADEVERLYAAAAAQPPLNEPAEVAKMFADLYRQARNATLETLVVVTARHGNHLIGLAYGHGWKWGHATDAWSQQLRDRLGDRADALEDSFAVQLLVVAPHAGGNRLGRRLLQTLIDHSGHAVAWLQTTDLDTPARRLYTHTGWTPLGHGPASPNGKPGLVMIHRTTSQ